MRPKPPEWALCDRMGRCRAAKWSYLAMWGTVLLCGQHLKVEGLPDSVEVEKLESKWWGKETE